LERKTAKLNIMKIKFREPRLSKQNHLRLEMVNSIIEEYQAAGYTLTIRQLYYQLVSRDIIPNADKEYGKVGALLKEGRMGGIVDWNAIEDRLRKPSKPSSWENPASILDSCINSYAKDRQEGQPTYMEVWVEKDALSGVLKRVTEKYHVRIMVNRGYSSVSAMYDAFMRFVNYGAYAQRPSKILYLGDFDPSGLDMIRDISTRIEEFKEGYDDGDWVRNMKFEIQPIALTMDQVEEYNPPPNPAKLTDSRAADFVRQYGYSSWEVDALRPEVLNEVLKDAIVKEMDMGQYRKVLKEEIEDKQILTTLKESL